MLECLPLLLDDLLELLFLLGLLDLLPLEPLLLSPTEPSSWLFWLGLVLFLDLLVLDLDLDRLVELLESRLRLLCLPLLELLLVLSFLFLVPLDFFLLEAPDLVEDWPLWLFFELLLDCRACWRSLFC